MNKEELLNKIGITEEYFNRKINYMEFSQDEWKKYSEHWREIQQILPQGRICFVCGKIFKRKFIDHLNTHNLTPEDWYCELNRIPKVQHKCKICGRPTRFNTDKWKYEVACNRTHGMMITHQYMKLISKNTHPDLTDEQIIKHNERAHKTQRQRLASLSRSYKCGWHSKPEDILGELLNSNNIKFVREFSTLKGKYRIDYYLPDYNIGLECDGMFKWTNGVLHKFYSNRAEEIFNKTGIKIINIPSDDIIFKYRNNSKLLLNLIGINYSNN